MCDRLGGSRGGAQGIGITLVGCPIPGRCLQQLRHALGVPVRTWDEPVAGSWAGQLILCTPFLQ